MARRATTGEATSRAGSDGHVQTATPGGMGRILVIDDEPTFRETLSEYLSLAGYDVETAASGAEGVACLGDGDYDLLVSDVQMPGLDGIAVVEWAKETHPDLPVVVMSGQATVNSTIQALRLRADDYLLKPFGLDEMERTIRNCLDRRRLEARNTELAASNARLREIERIKDDLLATVSHEFRTPLTAMRGFLEFLLMKREQLAPDQLQAVEAIASNGLRLQAMIDNLLTLTECQTSPQELFTERQPVARFWQEYLRWANASGRRTDFELDIEPGAEEIAIEVDRIRFPIAVANLLDNAFKFSHDPGEVRVLVRVRREGGEIVFEVHDDGIGIHGSLGETVFERFTQGDMSATREFQGTGLGLAVVREVTRLHGGSVRLIAPLLGGASVRMSLPIAEPGA